MTKTQTQSDVLHMAEMFMAASIVLEDDPDEADFLGDSEDLYSWRMDWEIFSRMISLSDWECEKQLGREPGSAFQAEIEIFIYFEQIMDGPKSDGPDEPRIEHPYYSAHFIAGDVCWRIERLCQMDYSRVGERNQYDAQIHFRYNSAPRFQCELASRLLQAVAAQHIYLLQEIRGGNTIQLARVRCVDGTLGPRVTNFSYHGTDGLNCQRHTGELGD
ncbi:hypothetical protein DFH09DRAFT_1095806 [Mycena vulgaris]|nr:hypothetical protein DFH09DRAFT_1095806 [Mycena vulgaris]